MTEKQMNDILQIKRKEKLLNIDDLKDKTDKTLIYGYTCDRETFHVYIKNKNIYVIKYGGYNNLPLTEIIPKCNEDYIPNKRVYPYACNFEFCQKLKELDIEIPFTTFRIMEDKTYFAKTLEEKEE